MFYQADIQRTKTFKESQHQKSMNKQKIQIQLVITAITFYFIFSF